MLAIEFILLFFILIFLILGAYTDWKKYEVSNEIVFLIFLLCIPLFKMTELFILQILFLIVLITCWKLNQIGAADIKIFIPLSFIFNEISYIVFIIMVTYHSFLMMLFSSKKVPLLIPITISFLITFMINIIFN